MVLLSCKHIYIVQATGVIFVLIIFEVSFYYAVCPIGFDEVARNVCLIGFQKTVTFCFANELCEEEGLKRGLRLFIPGLNAFRIPSAILSPNKIFTSITAFLNRSTVLEDGWQVGDPGFSGYIINSQNHQLPWLEGDPNYPANAITILRNGDFIDDSQQILLATFVLCELSSRASPGTMERFNRNWPFKLGSIFFTRNDAEGCFVFHNAATLMQCAMKCKIRLVCRSFYYNEYKRDCYMSLYVDSLLPYHLTSKPGNWERFARPFW
ncbi:hypothetical protein FGIG_09735 [Fasciola gigantica]|uniref:Apple domain-containing protein n=1 Tax=Fasciola gigantica TaxID=46835 RepID=A0A504YRF0_FASGI|nr:hypothetical protein FGIG_09735 [Fasciola gigantica]